MSDALNACNEGDISSGDISPKGMIKQGNKLCLELDSVDGGLLSVDFFSPRFIHRVKTTGIKSDLAKACSLKSFSGDNDNARLKVLDLTAGLGTDAVMLACLGAQLTLLEREPSVHAILNDGLQRVKSSGFAEYFIHEDGQTQAVAKSVHDAVSDRVTLLPRQDSFSYLSSLEQGDYDCIYFDPMFPERKKAAKVKLAMQVFHELVGFDFQQDEKMLMLALQKAKKRVVVKRSKQADFIGGKEPSYSIKLKALRYDIYLL